MELELVPQKDPATLRSGDTLPVRLLADGKPIAERWVTAWHRAPDGLLTEVKERTDADGRVDLLLPHAGGWLLRAVHMTHTDGRFRSWWTAAGLAID